MKQASLFCLGLILNVLAFAQIPESENNNTFSSANVIQRYNVISGSLLTSTDDDYFMTILPEDGTLNIHVQATNVGTTNNWIYAQGYDRRKTSESYGVYVSSPSVAAGTTITDVITLYGRAADTFYFKFYTNGKFNYQFHYTLTDVSTNDPEQNNSFSSALLIDHQQTKLGHTNYIANGGTYDPDDYYSTIIPEDGTMKIFVKGINTSGGNNWLYLETYDRRKTSSTSSGFIKSSSVPANSIIYDTITLYGRAADTFYFRFRSNGAYAYEFRYQMVETSQNDVESNNTFLSALQISASETKVGHTNYLANGSTYDPDDYYRTIIPEDGTMKIYVKGINRSGGNNWLYLQGYDRRMTSETFGIYVSSSSVPAHSTIYDTITLYGRAADTFYFRFRANGAYVYEFRYQMVETSINDPEPNNTFATATPVAEKETRQGHTNYLANGGTYDPDDFYRTIIPVDGTMKIYVKGINRSGGNNWLYIHGYDRRKTSETFGQFVYSSSVPAGNTIYDTITVYSRAADTFYFQVRSSAAYTYFLSYEMIDTSENDLEANNTIAEAQTLSGSQVISGHIGYRFNGTFDVYDYYKTEFGTTDSLKLYIQATNYSGATAGFFLAGYNSAQSQIYSRNRFSVPAGTTIYDSVKILVTAPQTIYNRVNSSSDGFSYQLSINSKLPGNGFSITGRKTACAVTELYKAVNVIDNNVTYHWTLTSGGTLNFTDSIATVNWTTAGTHVLKLYLSNADGNSVTRQIIVTVNDLLPLNPPVISNDGRFLKASALPFGATYQWLNNGVVINNAIDSIYYSSFAGVFSVRFINSCGNGPASSTIAFATPNPQSISFAPVAPLPYSPDSFRVIVATATSGLPVTYKILSGPGIMRSDTLFATGFGNVVIQARQTGNTDYSADSATYTVNVGKGGQSITFNTIPDKIYVPNTSFAPSAFASSGLAVSYSIVSGPATFSGGVIKLTGVGIVQVRAKQNGNANYHAAADVDQSFCVGIRQIDTIKGPALICAGLTSYTTKKITGAIYQWTLSGGGTLTTSNDTAKVNWQTTGTYTLTVKARSACDTVYSDVRTLNVTVDTDFNVGPITGMSPANNATGLELPVNLQWNPATKATSYDLYVWPASQTEPAIPLDTAINQVNYSLMNNIALNVPYNWKVVGRNICSSTQGPIQQFTVAQNSSGLPDLVLDTLIMPVNIYQGQAITITWRVKNIGTKGTGLTTWKDRVFISPSTSIRHGESTYLNEYNNPSYLLPGESYTQTKTITIPAGFSGTWYIGVITENGEAFCFGTSCIFWGPRYNHGGTPLTESNEYNNYRYEAVPVLDGPLPDLQVKSVAVPGAVFGGSNITVTYKVQNHGTIPAAGSKISSCLQRGWRDRFFISKEPVFDITTTRELNSKDIIFLKPGSTNCAGETLPYNDYLLQDSSYIVQHQLVLPYDYFGKQYIYVYTNGYNDVFEGGFNTNNIRRSDSINVTIAPPADLVVSNIENIPNILAGEQVTVNFTVANQGANAPYELGWSDSLFICSSPSLIYSNVIAKGNVNRNRPPSFGNGGSYDVSTRLTLPNGINGTYYLFVKTDARKEVFEYTQEGNNVNSTSFNVTLGPLLDLEIITIALPDTIHADIPFNFTYTIKNNGVGVISDYWQDYFYASTDSILAINGVNFLAVTHNGSDTLPAGAARTYTKQALIRTSHNFSDKNIFIKSKADGRDFIYEHNAEGNNLSINMPPVGNGKVYVKAAFVPVIDKRADLAVIAINAPASDTANSSATVSWTVRNIGSIATTKTYWQDRIYLSSDTAFGSTDIELKRVGISEYTNTGLLPDSQYSRSVNVELPLKISGTYYFIVFTDINNYIINDSIQANNRSVRPINVLPVETPDLVLTTLNNLPDSLWGGSSFTLRYSVQNIGVATATGTWYDRVNIQTDNVPNGFPITSRIHNTPLPPGASYVDSINVTIPTYLNGNYYILLNADGGDRVYEGPGSNANNLSARQKQIFAYNSRPAPDLIVQSVIVPDSVVLGKQLNATYTIKNVGIIPAKGNLANVLYLSSNQVYESSIDKLLNSSEIEDVMLNPGESFMAELSGKALPDTAGLYRSIVRTNTRATLHEGSNLNNNTKASDSSTYIEAQLLTLGVAVDDILIPGDANYYKVIVAADLDLSVQMTSGFNGAGSNSIFIAHNKVPNESNFDGTGVNPSTLDQQALISSTQAGAYYIKAQSFGLPVNEPVTITVTALPFSIINATPSILGKGIVTGVLYGAGFKPSTQVLLRKNGVDYHVGFIEKFVNSTKLEMEWRLEAVPVGIYDVVAINPGGIEAILPAAITVEVAREYEMEYTPILPSEVRPFGGVFTYKGKNTGNVNIPVVQGDVTMIEKNATVHSISTEGRIRRYTKYFPQVDSLLEQDWYLTGKNRAVPFFGRNIAPGEEFSITLDLRFKGSNVASEQNNVFPLQCRIVGYSASDFVREQVRVFEMLRLMLVNDPRAASYPNSVIIQGARAGSKFFVERMMQEYVTAGLMQWRDTVGTNLEWNCSRCLQNLPEVRPPDNGVDSFTYSPAGEMVTGTDSLGTGQVFRENESLLIEMNKGRYWNYYNGRNGAPGVAGTESGWDLVNIEGTLFIDASINKPFTIFLASMGKSPFSGENRFKQLGGWNPAYDTSYLIVIASQGINGYDPNKFKIDLTYFATLNGLQQGHFTTELRRGFGLGGDSIVLKWNAFKPGWGEPGVNGVDGAIGEPGSPGGKGGPGNAQNKGGRGGNGGRGGDEYGGPPYVVLSGIGGRGGDGGDGYGSGGDGGNAGNSGNSTYASPCEGEIGGRGANGGPNGGTGGKGGEGGDGGSSSGSAGGKGGDGGDGGTATNSSYGGAGGNGGDGGGGGGACGHGLPGGAGGEGGIGGAGPLGEGTYGASGKKGIFGPPLDCPPCSSLLPSPADAAAAADKLIDYGKAALDGPKGIYLEYLNQSKTEHSASVQLIVHAADLIFSLAAKGATIEWTIACKAVAGLFKIGDFIADKAGYSSNSNGRTLLKFMIDGVSAVSSVPDFAAFVLKQLTALGAGTGYSSMVKPCDPNEIKGHVGHGDERFVSRTAEMPYTIHFENDSAFAQVAAQRVVIRQPIHAKADPLTFRLGDFNFGGNTFTVPTGKTNYFTVLNLDSLGYRVEVTAGIDIVAREAFWIMQTIDPLTGMPPSNVFLGMLPVNDETEKGTGFVRYTIKPLATAVTGDSITAKAGIVFDENEPVETNTWRNIIDAVAPTSSIIPLQPTMSQLAVPLTFTSTDDPGGSGLKFVDVYVSDNSGPAVLYAQNFTATDTTYFSEIGHTYTFYGSATDNVGNKEALHQLGETSIVQSTCIGSAYIFNSNITGSSYQWQVDAGSGFTDIQNGPQYGGVNTKTLNIYNSNSAMAGYQYRIKVNGNPSQVFTLKFITMWTGTNSKVWEDPANWSCNAVPNQFTDVVIPPGKARYPDINANTVIRSIELQAGAQLTLNSGFNLTLLK